MSVTLVDKIFALTLASGTGSLNLALLLRLGIVDRGLKHPIVLAQRPLSEHTAFTSQTSTPEAFVKALRMKLYDTPMIRLANILAICGAAITSHWTSRRNMESLAWLY